MTKGRSALPGPLARDTLRATHEGFIEEACHVSH